MRCIFMCGLFSAVISCLRDSIHPPEMEIDPQKTACGSPIMWGGGGEQKQKRSHTLPSHPMECIWSVHNRIYRVSPGVFSMGCYPTLSPHGMHLVSAQPHIPGVPRSVQHGVLQQQQQQEYKYQRTLLFQL